MKGIKSSIKELYLCEAISKRNILVSTDGWAVIMWFCGMVETLLEKPTDKLYDQAVVFYRILQNYIISKNKI